MRRLTTLSILALAACSKGSGLPAAVCTKGTSWAPGAQAFQDATTAWGLDQIDAEGVRISVADIDNDGWPDLIVRQVGAVPDQGPTGGARSIWLLRNTGHKSFEDVTYSSGIL